MKKPAEPAAQLLWGLMPGPMQHAVRALEALMRIPAILIDLADRLEALEQAAARDRDSGG